MQSFIALARPIDPRIEVVTSSSVQLSWLPGNGSTENGHFLVQYRHAWTSWISVVHKEENNEFRQFHAITGLQADVEYFFRVASRYDDAGSKPTDVIKVHTRPGM